MPETPVADTELAAATRAAARTAGSYVDACIAAHALVGQRLAQARSVLGHVASGTDGRTGS